MSFFLAFLFQRVIIKPDYTGGIILMKTLKIFAIFSIAIFSLTGCGAKISQTADTLTVEAGSELNFHPMDCFTSSDAEAFNDFVIDSSKVKTDAVGTYEIKVAYKDDVYTISVDVVDTTAPVIESKSEIPTVNVGDTIKAENYVDIEDLSDCKIFFSENQSEELICTADNTMQKIVVEDASGNKSEIEVEIPRYMTAEEKLAWLQESGLLSDTDLESSVTNSEKDIMNELGIDEGTPSGNTSGNQGGQQSSGGGNVSTPEREDTPSGGGNGFSTEGLTNRPHSGEITTGGSSGTITQEDIDAFNQANGR